MQSIVCVGVCVCVWVGVCVSVSIYIYMYRCVCVWVCAYVLGKREGDNLRDTEDVDGIFEASVKEQQRQKHEYGDVCRQNVR